MASEETRPSPYAIGCLLIPPGFFGGAMIALGVGMLVDRVTGCIPEAGGATVCNAGWYILVGGVVGLVVLEVLVQRRLRRGAASARNSERS